MTAIELYQTQGTNVLNELVRELNLVYYASEAAERMEFGDVDELHDAVKRAMEICTHAGLPLEANFKRIYKCSYHGITYDWKVSVLAFHLICLNGDPGNENTAHMQVDLLRNQALNR
jgi:hypothetical protein